MQVERSVYEAATRGVLHQREPDGTRKAPPPTHPPEGVPAPSAGIDAPLVLMIIVTNKCIFCITIIVTKSIWGLLQSTVDNTCPM